MSVFSSAVSSAPSERYAGARGGVHVRGERSVGIPGGSIFTSFFHFSFFPTFFQIFSFPIFLIFSLLFNTRPGSGAYVTRAIADGLFYSE